MTSDAVTAVPRKRPADRSVLANAGRIVVKVGSSSLTSIKGGISEEALTALADALAAKRNAGTEIILVSSGAIAAGLAPLGLAKRPRDLATQQAAASVGQGLLMARYTQAFGAHGVTVSQVLLT
ncbi:MAG TPA: glutamate 5-kinase, partial [Arthrobacter bacterium]|nr:glutamate 5-kinase [Arthrobacter sp.]